MNVLLFSGAGKLQTLDVLLRQLKVGYHRALIFTQMTKMLDVLESFLNFHGHRYLRLDGTTKVCLKLFTALQGNYILYPLVGSAEYFLCIKTCASSTND